ncbi:Hypothetical protein MVR_LOCUS385 [uncultured virus]|nr:Hypothetical protein MVR_LOCUS385 [uncultured virus]
MLINSKHSSYSNDDALVLVMTPTISRQVQVAIIKQILDVNETRQVSKVVGIQYELIQFDRGSVTLEYIEEANDAVVVQAILCQVQNSKVGVGYLAQCIIVNSSDTSMTKNAVFMKATHVRTQAFHSFPFLILLCHFFGYRFVTISHQMPSATIVIACLSLQQVNQSSDFVITQVPLAIFGNEPCQLLIKLPLILLKVLEPLWCNEAVVTQCSLESLACLTYGKVVFHVPRVIKDRNENVQWQAIQCGHWSSSNSQHIKHRDKP